jgi:hypothetical protein
LLTVGLLFSVWNTAAEEPDWTNYQAVLKHVKQGRKNGMSLMLVDYPAYLS